MASMVETMMSANAVVPWHKQGVVLDGYPTIDEAVKNSGLTWSVIKRPLFANCSNDDGSEPVYMDTPWFGLFRDTDNRSFGVCSADYHIFQNSEAFHWCKPLVESGEWKIETAGSLKNGHTCWILLNQGTGKVLPKDELRNYLLMTWCHDGRTSVRLGLTSIRVVCNNTLTQALKLDGGFLHKFAHNSSLQIRLSDAQELYCESVKQFQSQLMAFGSLADVELTKNQKDDYVDFVVSEVHKVVEEDDLEDMSERRKRSMDRTRQEINWFIDNGLGQRELKLQNNLWGAFNAVEAWCEKARFGKKVTDRGYDILFGRGRQIVDAAYKQAVTEFA